MSYLDYSRPGQKELDQCEFVSTILMDLSKLFDCLPHNLIIAKLEAYDLDMAPLSLLKNYLASHKQRTKVGSFYWLVRIHTLNKALY